MTSQEPRTRTVIIIALALSWTLVGQAAAKGRYERHTWQDGKLVDTDEVHYLALIFGSSSTRGNIHIGQSTPGYGTDATYSGSSDSLETPIYRVYQTYVVEGNEYVYIAKERLRWRWSKPARLVVNAPVQYAVEENDLYLLDQDGSEHKARIVKTILKPSPVHPERPAESIPPAGNTTRSPVQVEGSNVAIKSTPDGADVTVDGKFVGMTPSRLRLPVGDYWLLVQKKGFKDWRRTLAVSEGGSVTVQAALDQAP